MPDGINAKGHQTIAMIGSKKDRRKITLVAVKDCESRSGPEKRSQTGAGDTLKSYTNNFAFGKVE